MAAQHWVRFAEADRTGFGRLEGGLIRVFRGDMFDHPVDTSRVVARAAVRLLAPVQPGKVIALWNNFHQLRERLGLAVPEEPLYLIKSPNSYLAPGETIRCPRIETKVVFEGELAIVIGRTAKHVPREEAMRHVFGYTIANDVTAADILNKDASFTQWVRAKGYDTFCPFGPAVATGLDASKLRVKTRLDGVVRQDYPASDMRFGVEELVSRISFDMTLDPGDLILCGTSVGVGSMKPGSLVEVEIEGIGTLANRIEP
ncbi:MAG TPA: fumarylacetoacetate hydrolase family protein [Ramlibacter sp.]|uniref:fumarylacetoacetate hydrolase family protein n=1 Tax=Ramlibacter sp. TaxID=1917967 RepID=UPI002D1C5A0B|nr:fumarylacetoacetate hydrolase family protein [Ramlibacter sp.]HVZ44737.1 fumarylacetoacetate hydrolase family protein [Ramlibacter sp.]